LGEKRKHGQILGLDPDSTVAYANDRLALFRFRGEPNWPPGSVYCRIESRFTNIAQVWRVCL
jgi:hypothetical protein